MLHYEPTTTSDLSIFTDASLAFRLLNSSIGPASSAAEGQTSTQAGFKSCSLRVEQRSHLAISPSLGNWGAPKGQVSSQV